MLSCHAEAAFFMPNTYLQRHIDWIQLACSCYTCLPLLQALKVKADSTLAHCIEDPDDQYKIQLQQANPIRFPPPLIVKLNVNTLFLESGRKSDSKKPHGSHTSRIYPSSPKNASLVPALLMPASPPMRVPACLNLNTLLIDRHPKHPP